MISFKYIKPKGTELIIMNEFKSAFKELSDEIESKVHSSRGRSLALTKLEEASFWLNKSITHNDE